MSSQPAAETGEVTESDLEAYREAQRGLWDSGAFDDVAKRFIWDEGDVVVERAGVGDGDRVLDIACGSGNASISAAQAGASVTGLDIAPDLLRIAAANAASEDVELDLVEGDAAELPFDDESFDVVISVFGIQFAPRQADCAREAARVLRPGGRLTLINWTPGGFIGQNLKLISARMPKPPGFVQPPPLWGVHDHLAELFEGTGVELETETATVRCDLDSGAEYADFMAENYGPILMTAKKLGDEWTEARAELIELCDSFSVDPDRCVIDAEYLLATGAKEPAG